MLWNWPIPADTENIDGVHGITPGRAQVANNYKRQKRNIHKTYVRSNVGVLFGRSGTLAVTIREMSDSKITEFKRILDNYFGNL